MINNTKIFLVLNSGSSSEKFSLYEGEDEVCSLYFEGIEEDGKKKFICTITRADGSEEQIDKKWDNLDTAFKEAKAIFEKEGFINESHPLDGILVRVVAAGKYFSEHHIVDEETMKELKKVQVTNPLHVPGTERGIKNARETFAGVPVIVMSDSEALTRESRKDTEYALPKEIIEASLITEFSRIPKKMMDELIEAKDAKEFLKLLAESPYKIYADEKDFVYIEYYASKIVYHLAKRYMRFSTDPACVYYTYTIVHEIEIDNLKHIIEGLRYGEDAERIKAMLIY